MVKTVTPTRGPGGRRGFSQVTVTPKPAPSLDKVMAEGPGWKWGVYEGKPALRMKTPLQSVLKTFDAEQYKAFKKAINKNPT